MRMIILIGAALMCCSFARPPQYALNYIEQWVEVAQELERKTKVPTSIQLAQACIESGFGKSELCINAHNHFGIQKGNMPFEGYKLKGKVWIKYESDLQSWEHHADFLALHYSGNIGYNWKVWCKYSTGYGEPGYWQEVEKFIVQYQLYKYDL